MYSVMTLLNVFTGEYYILFIIFLNKPEGLTIYLPDTDAMTGMGKSCGMNNRIPI